MQSTIPIGSLVVTVILYYGVRKVRQILTEDDLHVEAVGAAERLT
jgi:hypothetical protein